MLKNILEGGPMMVPILILSILAIAVIIDRIRVFRLTAKNPSRLLNGIIEQLENGHTDKAIELCREEKGPIAAVLVTGLTRFDRLMRADKNMAEIEVGVNKSIADYSQHVIEALEKRLNLLTMIASVSPLLGMTGTVTGMISSFGSMSSGLDASQVSTGISEALVTTAAGLIVAIPAVIAYNIFTKKVDHVVLEIEQTATQLIDYITLDHPFTEAQNTEPKP
jgi:biopolymer transport protein ExbB|tara:strand:- start:2950 stop:3615 length:666 start_codon:yes stop_codon:yes gene_type:complete